MKRITSKIDDHTEIAIEVEEEPSAYQETGVVGDKVAQLVEDAFKRAVETIAAVGRQFAAAREQFGTDVPDLEVSFGVKITAGGDVWLAKVAGESQLTAKVNWKR